jgi:hypothetical protein
MKQSFITKFLILALIILSICYCDEVIQEATQTQPPQQESPSIINEDTSNEGSNNKVETDNKQSSEEESTIKSGEPNQQNHKEKETRSENHEDNRKKDYEDKYKIRDDDDEDEDEEFNDTIENEDKSEKIESETKKNQEAVEKKEVLNNSNEVPNPITFNEKSDQSTLNPVETNAETVEAKPELNTSVGKVQTEIINEIADLRQENTTISATEDKINSSNTESKENIVDAHEVNSHPSRRLSKHRDDHSNQEIQENHQDNNQIIYHNDDSVQQQHQNEEITKSNQIQNEDPEKELPFKDQNSTHQGENHNLSVEKTSTNHQHIDHKSEHQNENTEKSSHKEPNLIQNQNEGTNTSSNNKPHEDRNKGWDNTSNQTGFISRLLIKYYEFQVFISPFSNQVYTLFLASVVDLHIILKDKLKIPYPADLIVFTLIGYFVCSILLHFFCKVQTLYNLRRRTSIETIQ